MKVLFEEVKKQIADAVIGSTVEVFVSNGTAHYGAPAYYRRVGVLVGKTDTSIKVLIGKRNYTMKVYRQGNWVDGKWNENEYAGGLYSVITVAE